MQSTTIKMSALQWQIDIYLSTQLMKPNDLVILPSDVAHSFLESFLPL